MSEEKFNINVIGDKITLLKGEAPKQKSITPNQVDITGNIFAPSEFWSERKGKYDIGECHAEYNKEGLFITLHLNYESPYPGTVKGILRANPELIALGINNYEKTYDKSSLLKLIKSIRHLFYDKSAHDKMVKQFRNFSATFTKVMDEANNLAGDKKALVHNKLEHSLKLDFVLEMKLYSSSPEKTQFPVNIWIDYEGSDKVVFYLESFELIDKLDKEKDKLFDEALQALDEMVNIQHP